MGTWGHDTTTPWGDVAAGRNGDDVSDYRGGNPAWRDPRYQKKGAWDAPGHNRMFHDDDVEVPDDPRKAFTTRKKHGWWGREVRYDVNGREMD